MELWFTEEENKAIRYGYKVKEVLFEGESEFQKIAVITTEQYGRMLVIDGCIMLTEADEFVYHEMITHIPVGLHQEGPKRAVVIGGGDGGTVRELLKYPSIEEVVLCEIDGMVVDQSKKWFPQVAGMLDDKRVTVRIGDGVAYMAEQENNVDLAIIDSTDPIGPGEGLFSRQFYKSVANALRPGGLMVAQSESPWHSKESLQRIFNNIRGGFPHMRPYIGSVPTYPRGTWSWTMASMNPINPQAFNFERFSKVSDSLSYLTNEMVPAVFALPRHFQRKINS